MLLLRRACNCSTALRRATASYSTLPSALVLDAARAVLDRHAAAALPNQDSSEDPAQRRKARRAAGIQQALDQVAENESLIKTLDELSSADPDPDMRQLALDDLSSAREALSESFASLSKALLASEKEKEDPTPPRTGALLEIKAGVGGSESTLFAGDLLRMYTRFASRVAFKSEVVSSTDGASGGDGEEGIKEALLELWGENAFERLRREAGIHRVQRVPKTESQGRVHTSTAAVIVLPAMTDATASSSKVPLYEDKDVKVEVMRSRGAGGQHVNRTESAVRLTHLPTGVTVSMQDSRSQHENRAKAYRVLSARLLDRRMKDEMEKRRKTRLTQVRTGAERGDKVRTYNFPQDRVTDHRIPLSLNGLEDILEGGEMLDVLLGRLEDWEQEERLKGLLEEDEDVGDID